MYTDPAVWIRIESERKQRQRLEEKLREQGDIPDDDDGEVRFLLKNLDFLLKNLTILHNNAGSGG